MRKPLLQKLGLLGVVSLLSYTAAVVFAPLAYPGYRWTAQAVSDLSAAKTPRPWPSGTSSAPSTMSVRWFVSRRSAWASRAGRPGCCAGASPSLP